MLTMAVRRWAVVRGGPRSRKTPKRVGIACKHICACLYELCKVVNEDPRILVNLRKEMK